MTRRLAPRKVSAIALLIAGQSVAATARILRVGRRTIFRWLKQADFREEIDRRLAELPHRLAVAARPPHRRVASQTPAPKSLQSRDEIDPQELRRTMDFVNEIAARAHAKWRDSARNGTLSSATCETNPPKGDVSSAAVKRG